MIAVRQMHKQLIALFRVLYISALCKDYPSVRILISFYPVTTRTNLLLGFCSHSCITSTLPELFTEVNFFIRFKRNIKCPGFAHRLNGQSSRITVVDIVNSNKDDETTINLFNHPY